MSARRWPNGLGWDVVRRHGTAEVRDIVTRLRAFVPMADLVEEIGGGKQRRTERHRVADYPLNTDPSIAVSDCAVRGVVHEVGLPIGEVPFRVISQTTIEL